jgi:hypothetical protein
MPPGLSSQQVETGEANAPLKFGQYLEKVIILSILRLLVRLVSRAKKNGLAEANMTRLRRNFRSTKSVAGAALVGFGMFILYENLAGAVAWLNHVRGANSFEALGVLPAFMLAVSQVLPAHAANHQHFLQASLQHMLVSSWPLLLVMVGTVLSRDRVTDNVNAVRKNDRGLVDLTTGRSTLE